MSFGVLEKPLFHGFARLEVLSQGKISLAWVNSRGRTLKSPSKDMREHGKTAITDIRALKKDMERDLSEQAKRIERFYLTDKRLNVKDWRQFYVDHPFIGSMCRALIWQAESAGRLIQGLWNGKEFCDLNDKPHNIAGARITLWHPRHSEDNVVSLWRDKLTRAALRQPFRQVWRETYCVTEAEQVTGHYSNRFAGHILRQHQFMKLAHINGWKTRHRMWVDAKNDYPAHITLPAHNLYAEFWVEGAGGDDPPVTDNCAYVYLNSDRLSFYTLNPEGVPSKPAGLKGERLSVDDVDPLIFSELMRHCDLFVSVSSIARDPNWRDRGQEARHPNSWYDRVADQYWSNETQAELVTSAEIRKTMLSKIVGRMTESDRWSLTATHLCVTGRLDSYKIHLGSAAVIKQGNQRHICIVPKSGQSADLILPFTHDRTFSLILSKALMLIEDDKITDPVILAQLG